MEPIPVDSAVGSIDAGVRPTAPAPSKGVRIGASSAGLVGGLVAIAGFTLPWFVFVVAISLGCRAPLQIELYGLAGAALAVGSVGDGPAAGSIAALACAVAIVIICIASLRRPTLRRARLLLMAAIIGIGALCIVGALATRGQITPKNLIYAAYLGFGIGFWITIGGLLLSWISGAILHAAMRPSRKYAVVADLAFAALGIAGLLTAGTIAITERPAPYPALSCAQAPSATPGSKLAYFTSADGLYALDAATGRLQWRCRNPLGGIVTAGPPALAASGPIVASLDGYVYAVRATDGAILWRADIGGRGRYVYQTPSIAPIVADEVVYGVNGANKLYALRASDGARLWSAEVTPPTVWRATSLLVTDEALLYLANDNSRPHLTALDSQGGHLLWQSLNPMSNGYPYGYPFYAFAGAVYDEEIDPQTREVFLVAHAVADGVTRWRYQLTTEGAEPTPSIFTVADGGVYLETRAPVAPGASSPTTPHVIALRARDGAVLWSTAAPDGASEQAKGAPSVGAQTYGAIMLLGGRIYLVVAWPQYTAGITLYGFDARRGSVLWRADKSYPSPPPAPVGVFSQIALVPTNGAIYLLDPFTTVERLDPQVGGVQWRRNLAASTPGGGVATAALYAGSVDATVASATGAGLLYVVNTRITALDPESSAIRWRYTPETPTTPYMVQSRFISSPTFAP